MLQKQHNDAQFSFDEFFEQRLDDGRADNGGFDRAFARLAKGPQWQSHDGTGKTPSTIWTEGFFEGDELVRVCVPFCKKINSNSSLLTCGESFVGVEYNQLPTRKKVRIVGDLETD
jgi:hypothetical protein